MGARVSRSEVSGAKVVAIATRLLSMDHAALAAEMMRRPGAFVADVKRLAASVLTQAPDIIP